MGIFKSAVAKMGSAAARSNIRSAIANIRANPNDYVLRMKEVRVIHNAGITIMGNIINVEKVSPEQAEILLSTLPRYAEDLAAMNEALAMFEEMQ